MNTLQLHFFSEHVKEAGPVIRALSGLPKNERKAVLSQIKNKPQEYVDIERRFPGFTIPYGKAEKQDVLKSPYLGRRITEGTFKPQDIPDYISEYPSSLYRR